MQDNIILKAPAKINLFLNVVEKRSDGYHNIRSGITFVNLFDEIKIQRANSTTINYYGDFKPLKPYADCIINKTLKILDLNKKINLKVDIKKNIPVQAGLGSASTNAAFFIQGLKKMKIIKSIQDYKFYSKIGADVPAFLYGKNCIVEGVGDIIKFNHFPKLYFLIVKPEENFSTFEMYNKLIINNSKEKLKSHKDKGNDFEKIIIQENCEIQNLLQLFRKDPKSILSGITGTGSCCYSAFEKPEYSFDLEKKIRRFFPKLWLYQCENHIDSAK